jgi:hypothetical protein
MNGIVNTRLATKTLAATAGALLALFGGNANAAPSEVSAVRAHSSASTKALSVSGLLAVGPVDHVSVNGRLLTVLGSNVQLMKKASFAGLPSDYVAVFGTFSADGTILASHVIPLDTVYAPGASLVIVSGRVGTSGPDLGTAAVGSVTADFTALGSDTLAAIKAAQYAVVFGLHFGPGSALQAKSALAVSGSGIVTIQGTGIQAIDGTGIHAIDGTGVQAIDGTGILAIDGTGIHAIDGTGVLAIDGTGVQAIDGTGVQAIDGTGVQAIDGTGVQAIDGTGIL